MKKMIIKRIYQSSHEQNNIMSLPDNFPHIQMCFEKAVQNTFHKNDIFMAIPVGIPSFLWCTSDLATNTAVCVVISNNQYLFHFDIPLLVAFIEGQGTILSATNFVCSQTNFFAVDNIYYYCGTNVTKNTWGHKLYMLKDVFVSGLFNNHDNIMVGLPYISYSKKHFQSSLKTCPYEIEKYVYRNFHQSNISFYSACEKEKEKEKTTMKRFRIKASPLYDIYHLYEMDDIHCRHKDPMTLNIPNYKTSVKMNTLFRNIKENTNLDLLEESDDEEEFQGINNSAFTDVDKVVEMECYYDEGKNKWTLTT
jgi:hypothetical protein